MQVHTLLTCRQRLAKYEWVMDIILKSAKIVANQTGRVDFRTECKEAGSPAFWLKSCEPLSEFPIPLAFLYSGIEWKRAVLTFPDRLQLSKLESNPQPFSRSQYY